MPTITKGSKISRVA